MTPHKNGLLVVPDSLSVSGFAKNLSPYPALHLVHGVSALETIHRNICHREDEGGILQLHQEKTRSSYPPLNLSLNG